MTEARQSRLTKLGNPPSSGKAPDSYWQYRQNPSKENLGAVRKALEPTINSALTSYAGGDPSLHLRARILATDAIKSFDPDKGAALSTHVHTRLQRLRRIAGDRRETLHIPERRRVEKQKIEEFVNRQLDETGRDPSLLKISDELKIPLTRVARARNTPGEVTQSAITGEKGDILASSRQADPFEMWKDFVYYDLDETGRKIFEWTTGYRGSKKLPKTRIAAKLGISPAAVSGRLNTIQKRFRELESVSKK